MTEETKLVTNINIWNNHIFELRIMIELYEDHRSEGVSTKTVEKKKPERIQAWTGIEPSDTGARYRDKHELSQLTSSKLAW